MVSKRKLARFSLLTVAVLVMALFVAGTVLASTALTIPLNNDTASTGTDCPLDGNAYWHFVISPNSNSSVFITFYLKMKDGSTFTTTKYFPNGEQLDNVFVEVPAGQTLTSLVKVGSTADITWDGTGNQPDKFQLSHVCPGAQDLQVSKTVEPSFTRTFKWKIDKSVDPAQINTADKATFKYTIELLKELDKDSDWALKGVITVKNINPFAVEGVNVTDTTPGGECTVTDGTNVTVPANSEVKLNYSCTFAVQPAYNETLINTALAAWDQVKYKTPSDHATVDVQYVFSQPTTKVLDEVDVTDSHEGVGPWHFVDSGKVSYDFTYTGDPAGTCTEHKNVATIKQTSDYDDAVAKVCVGKPLEINKTVNPSFTRTFKWEILKDADPELIKTADNATFGYTVTVTKLPGVDSDWAVSGVITVKNPNDWEPVTFDVNDSVPGGTCNVTGGANATLAAGASKEFPYSCTFAVKPPYNEDIINTATATWDKAAAYTLVDTASVEKKFQFTTPTKLVNDEIDVTDSRLPEKKHFTASGTWEYTYTYTGDPAGTCTDHENIASIVPPSASDHPDAKAVVKVCVGKPLDVSKTAKPEFTREYLWDVIKDVTPRVIRQAGGNATFNYTVIGKQTGVKDSDWKVSGLITVNNPNTWEPITFNLKDELPGADCKITGTFPYTLEAEKSAEFPYACAFAAQPPYNTDLVNTATATWDKAAAYTKIDFKSGSATFKFSAPTTRIHQTVVVTDTFNGGSPVKLGELIGNDAQPYATATYKYTQTVPMPASGCAVYNNTAEIADMTVTPKVVLDTDSEQVQVCTLTGARTMGFWQNKNGQGIITGQAKTGVCPSATWLRQYAPFQDLSATATCAQTAKYVYDTIKAATAGGAAMNAMLKAQMLATALDVYFSDPALGGVKLSGPTPPAPIGGVTVTLGKASAAFGGATELTVLQLLEYAAGQSNAGGSVWYAQVKATQELAKNVFDAINNDRDLAAGVYPDFPSENWGTSYIFIPSVAR